MSEIPTTDLDSAHQALDHMLVSVREHAWPNVPSVTVGAAEVEFVVLVDELGRIEGIVVSVIEGVLPDVERLRMLLQLFQLLGDLRPHRLRDNRTHRLDDVAQLDLQL